MQIDNLQYDGLLNLAVGLNVTSRKWKNTAITWKDLLTKLSTPVITNETYRQFIEASKDEQSRIKDVGGFVGGILSGGKRDKASVTARTLITLDIDFSHENIWWDFTTLYDSAACIHTTHKSRPGKLRHRLIMPMNRKVTPEEYQAIARKIAGSLNIDLFDRSTFDVNRLMFWPSVSSDIDYSFEYQDGPFLDADSILATYNDWHDTTEWPEASDEHSFITRDRKKQQDPETKKGIVGVFCRTYSIEEAISKFLSDVYDEAGPHRYTYNKGTTCAGLIIYDDKFAYSHHGTDPASGLLCNAFDLVRIHKFGHLDDTPEDSAREGKDQKSFKAMEDFAVKDLNVKKRIAQEKLEEAKFDFADGLPEMSPEEPDNDWMEDLTANKAGDYDNSANNLNVIFKNDPLLKNIFKLNTFDNKKYITKSLPWRQIENPEPFRDVDYSGVRNYIECIYGIVSSQKVDDALQLEFERNKFHPIQSYIKSLTWDGKKRIDSLLIDYFGAEDNIYTRAAIRKSLVAAVARVFRPGVKFDTALILVGEQGTYKSTFIKKLGREWFSDTFTTVQGKEAFEQIQGAWLIEMAELSGLKRAEVEAIKHYITKEQDQYRPAYGRTIETYKRQCVFFGTTNNKDFLHDSTGNRRFMPVDVRPEFVVRSVAEDLTGEEIDQIWAEAYILYQNGEPLYLSKEEDNIARIEQHKHSEIDERRGLVEEFLNRDLPENWFDMDIYDRRRWLDDPLAQKGTMQRDFVCVAEIWCECFSKEKSDMNRYTTRELNEIMRSLPDWEAIASTKNIRPYGKQKYYKRKSSLL